jgi:hypothetical protein
MKVEIGRHRAHDPAGAGVRRRVSMRVRGHGYRASVADFLQRIGQMKNDQVAGMDAQVRGFVARRIGVAVSNRAVGLRGITRRQVRFQDTILAAEVLRFFDLAPGLRTRTHAFGPYTQGCEA